MLTRGIARHFHDCATHNLQTWKCMTSFLGVYSLGEANSTSEIEWEGSLCEAKSDQHWWETAKNGCSLSVSLSLFLCFSLSLSLVSLHLFIYLSDLCIYFFLFYLFIYLFMYLFIYLFVCCFPSRSLSLALFRRLLVCVCGCVYKFGRTSKQLPAAVT